MSEIKNPLEIYQLLPKTNCRECQLPTCLAFSAAVIKGEKRLADCPHLDPVVTAELAGKVVIKESGDQQREEHLESLRKQVSALDFPSSAERLGASLAGSRLAVKCLGRSFFVDPEGYVTSECHTHAGLTIPLLSYMIHSRGGEISGEWVSFRELRNGTSLSPLFAQRCEKPLKQLADTHTDLFEDLVSIFSGERTKNYFSSDISLILYPLPKIPVLISYWKPKDDMESVLHVFFDSTAENFLAIESIFELGVGLVMMFEKIVVKHHK